MATTPLWNKMFGSPNISPVEQKYVDNTQAVAQQRTLNQLSGNGNAPVNSKPLPALSSLQSKAPQAQLDALKTMTAGPQKPAGPSPGQVAAAHVPPSSSAGANMATLVSPNGDRKAVSVGSPEAQVLFGQGYTLEGAPKTTAPTSPSPIGNSMGSYSSPPPVSNPYPFTTSGSASTPTNIPTAAPTASNTNPYLSNLQEMQKQLLSYMTPTDEEKNLQQQIAELHGATALGVQNQAGQGRGIPLALVQGAQEKLLNQGNTQEQTLQAQLANLIAQRQMNQNQLSKQEDFASQMYQNYNTQNTPKQVGDNLLQIDPITGKVQVLYTPPASTQDGFTLDAGQSRYDAQGNLLAAGPDKTQASPASVQEYEYAKANGYTGSFTDYQNQQGGGASKQPASVQEYQYAQSQGYTGSFTDYQKESAANSKTPSAEMLKLQGLGKSFQDSSGYLMNYIDTHWNIAGTLNPQEIARVNAAKSNLVDIIARLRTGAVIGPQEATRFEELIPVPTDTDKTAHFKMQQLQNNLQPILDSIPTQTPSNSSGGYNQSSSSSGGSSADSIWNF